MVSTQSPFLVENYHPLNHFYFTSMRSAINRFIKTCDICQRVKGPFPRLGHLPVKQAEVNPWNEVQIDLLGPWTFQIPPKWSVSVLVLTCIDPFSGLCIMFQISFIRYGYPNIHALSDASTTTARNSLRLHFNI